MRRIILAASLLCAQGAAAQELPLVQGISTGPRYPNFDPSSQFIAVNTAIPGGGYSPANASVALPDLVTYLRAQMGPDTTTSAALVGIAARLDRINSRFSEGIALAGSFNVLPPNPGDRFAVSIGGAGYNGAGAASISASARIDENTIVYGGVAQGPTQTMVKGGLGWSFR